MDLTAIKEYLTDYGAAAIFIIVFLEYLNLPGIPSGVVMPLAGALAAQGKIGFGIVLLLSVSAGLCGSLVLYTLSRLGGDILLKKYIRKFPSHRPLIDKTMDKLIKKGCMFIFVGKLIPVIRTLISIPAGVIKMNLAAFTITSLLGITVWNLVFVGAGYWFGDSVIKIFA